MIDESTLTLLIEQQGELQRAARQVPWHMVPALSSVIGSTGTLLRVFKTGRDVLALDQTAWTPDEIRRRLDVADQQRRDHLAGLPQEGCKLCHAEDHLAYACQLNPVILSQVGRKALLGDFWKCFHCGFVTDNVEDAKEHWGESVEDVARCLRLRADAASTIKQILQGALDEGGQHGCYTAMQTVIMMCENSLEAW